MPACDICDKLFGVESMIDVEKYQLRPEEGCGVVCAYGIIEAAHYYCASCWDAAWKTVLVDFDFSNGNYYPSYEDAKRIAHAMATNRAPR